MAENGHKCSHCRDIYSCLTFDLSSLATMTPQLTRCRSLMSQRSRSAFLLLMLTFLLVPSTAEFSDNQYQNLDMESPVVSFRCSDHFGQRVHTCVRPFTSLLRLFEDNSEDLMRLTPVVKHICLEYQMVLLCLHSALNDCQTTANLRRVQTTLDTQWVARTNQLCSIGSDSPGAGKYRHLNPFPSAYKLPHADVLYLARAILQSSLSAKTDMETQNAYMAPLDISSPLSSDKGSAYTGWKSVLNSPNQQTDSSEAEPDFELNVYDSEKADYENSGRPNVFHATYYSHNVAPRLSTQQTLLVMFICIIFVIAS